MSHDIGDDRTSLTHVTVRGVEARLVITAIKEVATPTARTTPPRFPNCRQSKDYQP
jgi:hypothetical protein